MLKNPNSPDPTGGAHSEGFIAPQTSYSWCEVDSMPIPNNPTPVPGLSIRLRFTSQDLIIPTELSVVNRKYDYFTTNTQ